MPSIYVPTRFASQPQIITPLDYAGLARGAELVLNPAVGPIDLAHPGRVWSLVNNTSKVVGKNGQSYNFDGNADRLTYTGYPEISGSVYTIAIWMPRVGAADFYGHVHLSDASTGYTQITPTGGASFAAGTTNNSGSTSGWFNSTDRSVIFTTDGTAAGTLVYIDGVLSNMLWTAVPPAITSASKALAIGSFTGGSNWDVDGSMLSFSFLKRVWGAAEARLFHESRGNALYKARNRAIYFSAVDSLIPSLFSNSNTFYSHTISADSILLPSLFSNTNTFYSHVISAGAVTLTPSLFSNTNTFYSHIVSADGELTPSLFSNTNTFYAHVISAGAVTLTPSLFSNTNTFYSHVISAGAVTLTPSLFSNTNTFYSHVISAGAVTLTPSLFSNTNTFYSHVIDNEGSQTLLPDLFNNTSSFYSHIVSIGLTPSLYTDADTFYAHVISAGAVTLIPSLFSNSNAFYAHVIVAEGSSSSIYPDLYTDVDTFFTHNAVLSFKGQEIAGEYRQYTISGLI